MARVFLYGLISVIFMGFQTEAQAAQPPAKPLTKLSDDEIAKLTEQRLKDLRPNIDEIKDSSPWGVNLKELKKRNTGGAKLGYKMGQDYSTLVPLYQKEKSVVNQFAGKIEASITKKGGLIKQKDVKKKSWNVLKSRNEIKKIEKQIQEISDTIAKDELNKCDHETAMNKIACSIQKQTGLTLDQISSLPLVGGESSVKFIMKHECGNKIEYKCKMTEQSQEIQSPK